MSGVIALSSWLTQLHEHFRLVFRREYIDHGQRKVKVYSRVKTVANKVYKKRSNAREKTAKGDPKNQPQRFFNAYCFRYSAENFEDKKMLTLRDLSDLFENTEI